MYHCGSQFCFHLDSTIVFRPVDIFNALKSTNTCKVCGVDVLAAEHFNHASPLIHGYLSLLCNCFITHGYLTDDFMKTAIVPIIKNKTGDSSDKGNYRLIALVTSCSKVINNNNNNNINVYFRH